MTFSKNFKNFMYNIKKNRNFKNILKIKSHQILCRTLKKKSIK